MIIIIYYKFEQENHLSVHSHGVSSTSGMAYTGKRNLMMLMRMVMVMLIMMMAMLTRMV